MKTFLCSGLLSASLLLGGCAGMPSEAARQALQQVRDDYAAGHYGAVIRTVATSDALDRAPRPVRIEALKLQAFSYCVTDYTRLCEEGFARILQIQPSFVLAPNERGHPQWGPAFDKVRAQIQDS